MLAGTLEPGEHIAAAFMAHVSLIHEARICSEKDLHLPNVLRGGHVELSSSPPRALGGERMLCQPHLAPELPQSLPVVV